MKKVRKIAEALQVIPESSRNVLSIVFYRPDKLAGLFKYSSRILNFQYRKSFIFVFFTLITLKALAPGNNMITLPLHGPINPFRTLIYATGMVETGGDLLGYNDFEKAVGIFQIRQCRVDEYNRRTGSKHTLADMFDYDISEKIFLYFASIYGPYHFERIAKAWNGSGPMTELYWKKIKVYLD